MKPKSRWLAPAGAILLTTFALSRFLLEDMLFGTIALVTATVLLVQYFSRSSGGDI